MGKNRERIRCRGPGKISVERATVVGLNGIGRQVAMQLVSIGVPGIRLIDNDVVERGIHIQEGFGHEEVGQPKVHAVAQACHQLNPMLDIETCRKLPQRDEGFGDTVFFCVPTNLPSQASVVSRFASASFLARYIPLGEVYGLEFANRGYSSTEPDTGPGSNASSRDFTVVPVHVASILAGLMIGEFAHFVSGYVPARKISFDPRIPALETDLPE